MAGYTVWFVVALVLAGVEMATGTLYILVLAIAAALGGVVALAGLDPVWQYSLAGVAAVIGTVLLNRMRAARPAVAGSNNLDIGQPVKVIRWNDDGTARVHYRGADWDATAENGTPQQETLFIKAAQGNTLILTHHRP